MDGGRIWKDVGLTQIVLTIEKLRADKDSKIKKSPRLYEFWLQLIAILEADRNNLFLE